MDYLGKQEERGYSFDSEFVRITLELAARDLDQSLEKLRDCTRIDRRTLELEVNI